MIGALVPSSLRSRLVAWVGGVLVLTLAATFAAVYLQTGAGLRAQIERDVRDDVGQLAAAARSPPPVGPDRLTTRLRAYMRAQPISATSSVLFAIIPGRAPVTNHPELFGLQRPDDGETSAEQAQENAQGRALLAVGDGMHTLTAPDVGPVRLSVRTIAVGGERVRLGAGEPLLEVTRAQRGVARAFLLAGAIALAIVLLASWLAGAGVLAPLRRLATVAERVDDGELGPRMVVAPSASREIRVLADAFNHMLDRLSDAFAQQRSFVADASHELRTPLTVIAGQLEVFAADPDPSPEEVQRVQRIVAAEVARTARLVDDLLLLTRAEQRDFVAPTAIDLRPFVLDLWAATTVTADRHFELGQVPEMTLVADPDRLAQALRNLIGNAVAHTRPREGRVRLEVEHLRRRGGVRFVVSDDGPGIPETERERVFERFHRTDASRSRATGGTGLGLAIVRAIATAHGGVARVGTPAATGGARLELMIPDAGRGRHVHPGRESGDGVRRDEPSRARGGLRGAETP